RSSPFCFKVTYVFLRRRHPEKIAMWRRCLGILAATIVAPYLVMFLWSLYGLLSGEAVGLKEPLDLLKTIPLGTFALLLFGIPLLILAGICAALVHIVERPTWRGPVLGG